MIKLKVVLAFILVIIVAKNIYAVNIEHGDWDCSFNEKNGTGLVIKCKGQVVVYEDSQNIPVDIMLKPKKWLSAKDKIIFSKYDWNKASAELSLIYRVGDLQLENVFKFGAWKNAEYIRRSMRIINLSQNPIKFYGAQLSLNVAKQGKYYFPAYPYNEKRKGSLANLADGFKFSSIWGCGPMLLEQSSKRSILFINDARLDPAITRMQVNKNSVTISSKFWSAGWLEPKQPQTIAYAYVNVISGNMNKAFHSGIWNWFDNVGIKVPADRPDWVYDSTMYYFPATRILGGYNLDYKKKGLVTAREKLLPKIRESGFNTVWVQPLEDKIGYWPRNYYKFGPTGGDFDDFTDFVKAGHAMGIRVMQDIVPHGGTPYFGELRGNSPFSLSFDEKGNARGYWCFDLLNPDWLKYVNKVAYHHTNRFKHDGFRIDACAGSLGPNWRRKGFPTKKKVPKNVSREAWEKALNAAGGECPALPYERASMSMRKGGLEVIKAIRLGARKANPNAIIIAETQHSPYMQETDVIYDTELTGYHWMKLMKMDRKRFVSGLQDLFEEQKYAEPRKTVRMKYVGCHDKITMRGFYNDNAYKAMNAIVWGIECMPMMFYRYDTLVSDYMRQLNEAREKLPELRRGQGFYKATTSSIPEVFSCIRMLNGQTTLVCVNLSAKTVRPEIIFSTKFNKLKALSAIDALSGNTTPISHMGNNNSITPKLNAWQAAYFRLGGNQSVVVRQDNSAGKKIKVASNTQINITQNKDSLEVTTGNYKLKINSGLISEMKNAKGITLLGDSKLIFNEVLDKENAKLLNLIKSKHQAVYEIQLPKSGKVLITYTFTTKTVIVDAALSDFSDTETKLAALVFKFSKPERYYISTSGSFVNEPYRSQSIHQAGLAMREHQVYSRPIYNEYIWQNIIRPLNPRNPVIGCGTKDSALKIKFENILTNNYDNIAMLEELQNIQGCFLACMWVHNSVPGDINPKMRRFQLVIDPLQTPAPLKDEQDVVVKSKNVKIMDNGMGWIIDTPKFIVKLSRSGGLLKQLYSKRLKRNLIENSKIYTNAGFRHQYSAKIKVSASAIKDAGTGVKIRKKGKGYLLSFHGVLATGKMGRIIPRPIWYKTQYYFDGSEQMPASWAVMSETAPFADKNANITGEINFSNDLKINLMDNGKNYICPVWKQNTKKKISNNAVLEYYKWKENEPLIKVNNFNISGTAPKSFYIQKQYLYVPWLTSDKDKAFEPQKWYSVDFVISLNRKTHSIAQNLFESFKEPKRKNNLAIPVNPPLLRSFYNYYDWKRPHSGGFAFQEKVIFGKKYRCMKLHSKFFKEVNAFKKPLVISEYPAGSKLKLSAIIKGENITPGYNWPAGVFRISFELANGERIRKGLSNLNGTYDWKRVNFTTLVPDNVRRAYIEAGIDGAKGKMWFADINLKIEK